MEFFVKMNTAIMVLILIALAILIFFVNYIANLFEFSKRKMAEAIFEEVATESDHNEDDEICKHDDAADPTQKELLLLAEKMNMEHPADRNAQVVIDGIREDMCDHFCKYSNLCYRELNEVIESYSNQDEKDSRILVSDICPMNRL